MVGAESKSALDGIKIANFCVMGAGTMVIKYFSQFGAKVVKVESHNHIDPMRLASLFRNRIVHHNNDTAFANHNSSMLSLSLDLTNEGGLGVAWKLIEWADVVAESFTPGTMKKWGLDYESVRRRKPDIVYISSSQMGQTGPHCGFKGYGYQAAGAAGFTYITGWPDSAPLPYGAYTDFTSCRLGALALIAALDYRRRTGKGQYIDLAQMESSLQLLALPAMDYFANGRILERQGNRVDYSVPHGVFPCLGQDRWVAIAISTDAEWRCFCEAIGWPEWTGDPRFSSFLARKENEEQLEELISEWTRQHTAEEAEESLQEFGVPAGVVETTKDTFEDPQLKHRNYFRQYKHSFIGDHMYRGPSFKLSKVPDAQFAGPCLGEHNEYVLKELLHFSDNEFAKALSDGSITTEADLPKSLRPAF